MHNSCTSCTELINLLSFCAVLCCAVLLFLTAQMLFLLMSYIQRISGSPYSHVGLGRGCAVCAGHQACVCNSLHSLFPSIAAEFDMVKNGFAPSEITAQSHKEVWWRSAEMGSWRQAVQARTKSWTRTEKKVQLSWVASSFN